MRTHLQIANDTLAKIIALTGEPVGAPLLDDAEITSLDGVVPSAVTWTEDRGNWAWDGALAALEAAGLDVHQRLPRG